MSVTIEYLADLFQQQNGLCACTGLSLVFKSQSLKGSTTASLDRLDNARGYEPGNIRWVHKVVNKMRGTLSVEEFIHWCRLVADHER